MLLLMCTGRRHLQTWKTFLAKTYRSFTRTGSMSHPRPMQQPAEPQGQGAEKSQKGSPQPFVNRGKVKTESRPQAKKTHAGPDSGQSTRASDQPTA